MQVGVAGGDCIDRALFTSYNLFLFHLILPRVSVSDLLRLRSMRLRSCSVIRGDRLFDRNGRRPTPLFSSQGGCYDPPSFFLDTIYRRIIPPPHPTHPRSSPHQAGGGARSAGTVDHRGARVRARRRLASEAAAAPAAVGGC